MPCVTYSPLACVTVRDTEAVKHQRTTSSVGLVFHKCLRLLLTLLVIYIV